MTEHHATQPTGKVIAVFVPTQSFEGRDTDGNLLGMYKQGKRYFLREGNTILPPLLEKWKSENKVDVTGA